MHISKKMNGRGEGNVGGPPTKLSKKQKKRGNGGGGTKNGNTKVEILYKEGQ